MSAGGGFLVVGNPQAGGAKGARLDGAVSALGRAGPVQVAGAGGARDLDVALDHLDGRTLVVAGGDGTVHAVVERLWHRHELADTTIGLVPLGTGNDLARGTGISLDPDEAVSALLDAEARPLDLMVDDTGGVVVNAAHAGLGAEAAATAAGMKDRLGPLAYPLGALIASVRNQGWTLRVDVDGHRLAGPGEGPLLMVGLANGPSIGGGTALCPGADPGDGLLDVVVAAATGRGARLAFANALRKGTHLRREDVHHRRGREVLISGEPIRHNADGEISGEVALRSYSLVPSAWSLLVPVR